MLEVCEADGKGRFLFVKSSVLAGAVVLREAPLVISSPAADEETWSCFHITECVSRGTSFCFFLRFLCHPLLSISGGNGDKYESNGRQ